MIYPFWEMGEDKYLQDYIKPTGYPVDTDLDPIKEQIIDNLHKEICYLEEKFSNLQIISYVGIRANPTISIVARKLKSYRGWLQNTNICHIFCNSYNVYVFDSPEYLVNLSCHIETIFKHIDFYNNLKQPGTYDFSYEKLYEILKSCENQWK